MDKSIIDILEELEQTPGSLAKKEILQKNKKNKLLKDVFLAAGDPYVVYYVNKFKMPGSKPLTRINFYHNDERLTKFVYEILFDLSSRKVTGNAAKSLVVSFMSDCTDLEQKWCQRILLKNMRCGVQTTVNKVWPGTIKGFEVALAETLKSTFVDGEGIKLIDEVTYPVRVEPKLDGLRCIAVKEKGIVTMYTRNGSVLDTLPKIKACLEAGAFDNVVFDGEGIAASNDWNTSASIMMSKKTKHDDSDMLYHVFDMLDLKIWQEQDTINSPNYSQRILNVAIAIQLLPKNSPIVQVPGVTVTNENDLLSYFQKCMDDEYEGVMIKNVATKYKFKRSSNILKLKPCVTYEGVIVAHYEGRHGTKREGLFGGFEVVLPNGVITRLGGGFSDKLKAEIQLVGPDSYIGKICELEAQPDPLTTDGLTKEGKARFPVYMRFRDESDVDPRVMKAYKRYTK